MKKSIGVIGVFLLVLGMSGAGHGQDRIVGGQDAEPGDWPWMAALVHHNACPDASTAWRACQYCAGSLIDYEWVITAAHCVEGQDEDEIDVVLKVHDLTSDVGIRVPVRRIIYHKDFDGSTGDSDIALLWLNISRLNSSDLRDLYDIPYLPLTTATEAINPGCYATVLGWGDTDMTAHTALADVLQLVSLPVISNASCEQSFRDEGYSFDVTDNMLCAGYDTGRKDSCQGDSGGPLIYHGRLAGIVSSGQDCGQPGLYGVYTRMSEFLEWTNQYLLAIPPEVTSTYPVDGAPGVSLRLSSIRAEFSKQLNLNTISQASFIVNDGSQDILGTVSGTHTTAEFKPLVALQPDKTYTATITTAVKDLINLNPQSDFTWSFTTGDGNGRGSGPSPVTTQNKEADGGICFVSAAGSF